MSQLLRSVEFQGVMYDKCTPFCANCRQSLWTRTDAWKWTCVCFFPKHALLWMMISGHVSIHIYIYLVTITRPPVPTTSSGSICPVSRWLWQSLAHSTPKFGQLSRWRQPWFHHQLLVVWTTYHQPDIYLMIINHLQFHQISLEQFSVCCSFLQTICSKSSPSTYYIRSVNWALKKWVQGKNEVFKRNGVP